MSKVVWWDSSFWCNRREIWLRIGMEMRKIRRESRDWCYSLSTISFTKTIGWKIRTPADDIASNHFVCEEWHHKNLRSGNEQRSKTFVSMYSGIFKSLQNHSWYWINWIKWNILNSMIWNIVLFPLHAIEEADKWNVPLPKVRAAADYEILRAIKQETTRRPTLWCFLADN